MISFHIQDWTIKEVVIKLHQLYFGNITARTYFSFSLYPHPSCYPSAKTFS